jgi:inosose dehydratase
MTVETQRVVRIANAPVSYGAFERTVGQPGVPTADAVLAAVADAGYEGIDLGPVGYLGRGEELREALDAHGLALAGGYVELPLSEPASLRDAWHELDAVLDQFDAAASIQGPQPPRPTLAHAPTPERAAHPGQAGRDRSLEMSPDAWRAFRDGIAEGLDRCRARGYEPTFHPELGTSIEAPSEIQALLEGTEIQLCLDTGHLLAGGGDPVALIAAWADRINQVHVKDARLDRMAEIVRRDEPADAVWSQGVFCPLGDGDLDVPQVLETLRTVGYRGWIVVEQDSLPGDATVFDVATRAQRENRRVLARSGF